MRYYYRCNDCLVTSTLEEYRQDLLCVCGGHVCCLGPVTDKGRWVRKELRPECDDRCLNARGPNCDCKCNGKNHGIGLAGIVEMTFDGGAVILRPLKPEESVKRAEDYRTAKAAVEQALTDVFGRYWNAYRAGQYIPNSGIYWALKAWTAEYADAQSLRTHKNRVKRLYQLADRIREKRTAVYS